jgi:hypothetical protein
MRVPTLRCASGIAAACLAVFLLAIPASAGAAGSKYPSANAARGFDGGAAGWDSSTSTEGICLPPLLCARAENSFQATGGADGGGFIRSTYTGAAGATAVGGTTTAVWQSPPFTYKGAGGADSGSVSFAMDRRANVDQLLAVAGSAAEYSVRLNDLSAGGEGMTLIAPTTLAGAGTWTSVSRGSIDPASLTTGDEYRIQISSRFTSGTSVLVTGSADYDNVVLSAATGGGGGNNGNGGKGKGGGGGGKGGGAFSSQRLEELLRGATPGTAKLDGGKRLLVGVNCPRKVGRQCRTTVQGLLKKGRPATARRSVRLRSGKSKLVALKVKPKARERVARRKRILVRQKVHAGKATATIFKNRLLLRR